MRQRKSFEEAEVLLRRVLRLAEGDDWDGSGKCIDLLNDIREYLDAAGAGLGVSPSAYYIEVEIGDGTPQEWRRIGKAYRSLDAVAGELCGQHDPAMIGPKRVVDTEGREYDTLAIMDSFGEPGAYERPERFLR